MTHSNSTQFGLSFGGGSAIIARNWVAVVCSTLLSASSRTRHTHTNCTHIFIKVCVWLLNSCFGGRVVLGGGGVGKYNWCDWVVFWEWAMVKWEVRKLGVEELCFGRLKRKFFLGLGKWGRMRTGIWWCVFSFVASYGWNRYLIVICATALSNLMRSLLDGKIWRIISWMWYWFTKNYSPITSIFEVDPEPPELPPPPLDCLEWEAGCGIIVISSLILSGFSSESFELVLADFEPLLLPPPPFVDPLLFPSIAFLATVLCAEYTWFSNCLYMPKVAVHTVHLYERWAGLSVMLWSRDTWLSSFHWYICVMRKSKIFTIQFK